MTYHTTFLKYRSLRDTLFFSPIYNLRPDLLTAVQNQRQYGVSGKLGNQGSADLWRAIVCPNCFQCVPRIFWQSWFCSKCKRVYDYGPTPELYQKWNFQEEFGVSATGHPSIHIVCPDDYRLQLPIKSDNFKIDKVFLHGDAFITPLSPTIQFNQSENGPNDLFNMLLGQAPTGQLPLRIRRIYPFDKDSGRRAPYFTTMCKYFILL